MRLGWRTHHARPALVLAHYSASRFEPVDPAEPVLAVVLAFAAEVAVEQEAFVGQVLALRPQRVRHTTLCQ